MNKRKLPTQFNYLKIEHHVDCKQTADRFSFKNLIFICNNFKA